MIVEHRFYRGGSSPDRLVFDSYEDFEIYLDEKARAGDDIRIWAWEDVCTMASMAISGKCPDDDGYVPIKGAY